jgi:hypothetical protein
LLTIMTGMLEGKSPINTWRGQAPQDGQPRLPVFVRRIADRPNPLIQWVNSLVNLCSQPKRNEDGEGRKQ